ncbi:hypothetical protein K501DRAFT_236950 [Backusella circina FSU 941]|nr:hypothetical protein K501DRAFT_322544 [Backusella circina FSU 941]KAI8890568.1 hypothetical protein K501DRAFT_236950 [Backusella circina FSU 941]
MQWFSTLSIRQGINNGGNWINKNRRIILNLIKWIITSVLFLGISFFVLCRLEVNAHVYIRNWFSPPTVAVVEPLSKCFQKVPKDGPYYQGNQKFTANFVPGIPVWEAHTCYDFAALFKTQRYPFHQHQSFHTYWSSNITTDFDEKPLATLRSFSATQNTNHSLTLWIPAHDESRLTESSGWTRLVQNEKRRDRISYKVIDPSILTKDTPLEDFSSAWRTLVSQDNDGRGRDDLLRMLVLYSYGGIWFDLDTMLVRDLSPLMEHEWIAQGSCSTGMFGNPFTGALFHFHQKSPYVCEILEGAADLFKARIQVEEGGEPPEKRYLINGPEIFGSKLYYRIYRRVLHHGIKPWSILPWCFTDPSQCKRSNSLPSMFSNTDFDKKRVEQTFAYHWRDRWNAVPGTIFNTLDSVHRKRTNW